MAKLIFGGNIFKLVPACLVCLESCSTVQLKRIFRQNKITYIYTVTGRKKNNLPYIVYITASFLCGCLRAFNALFSVIHCNWISCMYNWSFSFTHSSEAYSLGVGVNTQHKDKGVTRDVNLFLTRGIIKVDR